MADTSKPKTPGGKKQVRRSQFSKDTEKNLKAGERQRLANERQRVRTDKQRQKDDKRKERAYLKDLRQLEKTGLYNPKSHELTRYRRQRIARTVRENKELLSDRFFFIPVTKKQKAKGIERASALHMITSKRGIFIEKQGYEKAVLRRSSFSPKGELEIRLLGKYKQGENKGKIHEERIPLAPLDALIVEKERLRKAVDAFGPLGPNESLAFIIDNTDEGGSIGYSYNVYDDIELLIDALEKRYARSDAARIDMFRHIRIRKTTLVNGVARDWNREAEPHRTRRRKIPKKKVNRPFKRKK